MNPSVDARGFAKSVANPNRVKGVSVIEGLTFYFLDVYFNHHKVLITTL